MYIDPFLAGVATTLLFEFIGLVVLIAAYILKNDSRDEEDNK